MCSGARGEWGYGDGTHGGEPRGSMQEETTEPPGVGAGHKLLGICLEFKKNVTQISMIERLYLF